MEAHLWLIVEVKSCFFTSTQHHGLTQAMLHVEREAGTQLESSVPSPFFGVPLYVVYLLGRAFALPIYRDAYQCFCQVPQHLRECSLRQCLGLKPDVL